MIKYLSDLSLPSFQGWGGGGGGGGGQAAQARVSSPPGVGCPGQSFLPPHPTLAYLKKDKK